MIGEINSNEYCLILHYRNDGTEEHVLTRCSSLEPGDLFRLYKDGKIESEYKVCTKHVINWDTSFIQWPNRKNLT